ncbi:small subunit of terminase [Enterococcus faecalis]|uniref:phage terminase small subunit n=1 Tax=Enterococcus TaxID=1350 RepID=UPI0006602C94|nr:MULTISPECIES: phage terminase small subunit [Enterococcus]EGO2826235.1 small subunit of terminase [Enterococcus faecalis]EGO7551995.1 small subunit of terminase [Enterococcus faecalis]EGO7587012.1 small subunit of terminase [Enterococcus faecalis]EGO9397323.1 small subunit of terminase [Enterococcus faecalis]EGS7941691.1 small subunit of terminase [Enterococcus faecalis]
MDKKEQAKKYYEEGWKYKDISEKLSVPPNTLKSWRKRDKWERGGATKEVQPTNRGAPKGNQNAIGNKGNKRASPPKRNKNAVKTGEYEIIFADLLSDEEKDIYSNMNDDPFFILNDEIRLLKVRQFRMMKRIKEAEKGLNDEEVERLQQLRKIKTPIEKDGIKLEIKREVMQDVQVTRKTFRKLDDILAIEDALTRISNQLTKAVKQQNALLANDAKLQLLKVQTEKAKASLGATSGDMDMPVFIDDISGDGYE